MRLKTNLLAIAVVGSIALFGGSSASAKSNTTVEVKEGDTLEQIATAHQTTYVRIFDANEQIANPNTINAGEKLRIPDEKEDLPNRYGEWETSQVAAAAAAPAAYAAPSASYASTASTYTTRSYSAKPVNANSYYVGNGMWCTDYVHAKRPDVAIYGNAGYNWISSAQAAGKSTGSTPQAGAVAVTNGHVAYVDSVNADGSYTVSEMGWNYQAGNYNQRTVSPGTFGAFIY